MLHIKTDRLTKDKLGDFLASFQNGRYCYEGTDSLAVRGKIALARKGLDFAKAQFLSVNDSPVVILLN